MIDEFFYLVSMDSITFHEEKVAEYLKKQLLSLGFEVTEDHAQDHYNGTANNLYGYLKGTIPGTPILFSSHMDTVEPGVHKKAVIHEDGTITSDGTTILGADDISGIVAILEALRIIKETQTEHRDIEVLFTIAEEAYLKGSEVFDFSMIKAKDAYVLDLSGAIGEAAITAPSLISFQVDFYGKESHAGFAPESGIHAIKMAADAITKIKVGHVDSESTVNIGTILGGTATNIVPKQCGFQGEIRSFDHRLALENEKKIKEICEQSASAFGGCMEFQSIIHLYAYETAENSTVVRYFREATKKVGIEMKLVPTFGGSDNNNFMRHGINGIVLACGMHNAHSCKEYTTRNDLEKCASIVKELMICEG